VPESSGIVFGGDYMGMTRQNESPQLCPGFYFGLSIRDRYADRVRVAEPSNAWHRMDADDTMESR